MKYFPIALSGILVILLISVFVTQAYAADLAAALDPGSDISQGSFVGVKTITIEYPADLTLSALVRLGGPHAIGIERLATFRRAEYSDAPDVRQRATALSISYALVSDPWFGAHRPRAEEEDE